MTYNGPFSVSKKDQLIAFGREAARISAASQMTGGVVDSEGNTLWDKVKGWLGGKTSSDLLEEAEANWEENLENIDYFFIQWMNSKCECKRFWFSLLPAIETQYTQGRQVPEIKPGIFKKTGVNIKNFAIAGAPPAFQVLGLQPTMYQIVGLVLGNETVSDCSDVDFNGPEYAYSTVESLNNVSHIKAEYIEKEIVDLGRAVKLAMYSFGKPDGTNAYIGEDSQSANIQDTQPLFIVHNALIQNYRYFITRLDRTYYAFDFLLLDYVHHTKCIGG